MLWYTCLIKHAQTLLRTKDCCTHSLLHAQQDALTQYKWSTEDYMKCILCSLARPVLQWIFRLATGRTALGKKRSCSCTITRNRGQVSKALNSESKGLTALKIFLSSLMHWNIIKMIRGMQGIDRMHALYWGHGEESHGLTHSTSPSSCVLP
jgi:hypothetical protein